MEKKVTKSTGDTGSTVSLETPMTQDSKLLRVVLSVGQSRALGHAAVDNDLTPADFVRQWIDLGMPLTAVGVEKQPTAGEEEVAAGKWLATIKALEDEVSGLKDRLKLAQAVKVQAAPVVSKARENELLEEVNRMEHLLDVANKNLDKVMGTSDAQLVKIERLERELAQARGKAVVAPIGPAKSAVSDFDQSPEADELRKMPVVADPEVLANGLPVGKTMGPDGKIVEAGEAAF